MKRGVLLIALFAIAATGQQTAPPAKIDATRMKAMQNALRSMTLKANLLNPRTELAGEPARKCAVPLLEVPIDPAFDQKMVHRVPKHAAMPSTAGLRPCPGDYRIK